MITRDELQALRAPLPLKAHQVREGSAKNKVQWLVYLDRVAIIQHLDDIFPGEWSNTMNTIQLANGVIVSDCHITIRGITRGLNGADSSSFAPHDVPKSAGSDAFKRAAQMWGVGLYLYDAPDLWTEGGYGKGNDTDWKKKNAQEQEALNRFATWYKSLTDASQPRQDAPPTTQPVTKAEAPTKPENAPKTVAKHWIDDDASRKKFWAYTQNDLGLAQVDVYLALGVSSLHDFTGTKEQAVSMLHAYVGEMATSKKEVYN